MLYTVLLVGGRGTRLRSELAGRPKPMVDIAGRPFLEHMLLHLRSFEIRHFIFAVSHGREFIEKYFGDGASLGVSIQYSRESQPLGTAGALRKALPLIVGDRVLVLNGDSFADIDYGDLVRFHCAKGGVLTLTAVYHSDCRDFGRMQISDNRVVSFLEKNNSDQSPGYLNAGVYVFERALIATIHPEVVWSLESDVFPSLLSTEHGIYAFCTDRYFMDLGTPERLYQLRRDFVEGRIPLRGVAAGA